MTLAKRFGTAVIALTIDEAGMAKDVERKLEVAHRLYDFAVNRHGLEPSDLMFDPLTFTICTGNEDDRKLGLWTLEAIERIAKELPDCPDHPRACRTSRSASTRPRATCSTRCSSTMR
ncbi:MAG: dihydropteroate synthase [Pseudomonadota bacterium]